MYSLMETTQKKVIVILLLQRNGKCKMNKTHHPKSQTYRSMNPLVALSSSRRVDGILSGEGELLQEEILHAITIFSFRISIRPPIQHPLKQETVEFKKEKKKLTDIKH
ncbi:hypothetical protein ABFX02_07G093600 [Erythranthe guttata]